MRFGKRVTPFDISRSANSLLVRFPSKQCETIEIIAEKRITKPQIPTIEYEESNTDATKVSVSFISLSFIGVLIGSSFFSKFERAKQTVSEDNIPEKNRITPIFVLLSSV